MIEKLKRLRAKNKFSDNEWMERGLNPSSEEISLKMEDLLNKSIDEVVECIEEKNLEKRIIKV